MDKELYVTEIAFKNGYEKGKADGERESFKEIERMCIDTFGNFNHRAFAELKKKYTKE